MTLNDRINQLSDEQATRILRTIAANNQDVLKDGPTIDQAIQALTEAWGQHATDTPCNEGDVARTCLQLLANDPQHTIAIETMIDGPTAQSFDGGASIAIAIAALVVLQLHVEFQADSTGKWKIKVVKKPASEGLLKIVVEKLQQWLSLL